MAFKISLIIALVAQVLAALLALRLNLRYRIYTAWILVFAAATMGAVVRLSNLMDIWSESPTIFQNWSLWVTTIATLLGSLLLLGFMALVEPFFRQMDRAQDVLRAEHQQLSSIVRETEDELRFARQIQQRLLPVRPPEIPELDIHGVSEPAVWTSGDYFDYVRLQDGTWVILIGDVSGHGVGPALLMASTRASIRAIAPRTTDVGELLTSANQALFEAVTGGGFVTALAACYDPTCHTMRYAAAGHSAYLLKADSERLVFTADSPPLGVVADSRIATRQQPETGPGDILILVTDGITETENTDGEMYGDDRLFVVVEKHRSEPAREIVAGLLLNVRQFAENRAPEDDITVVIVKFQSASEN